MGYNIEADAGIKIYKSHLEKDLVENAKDYYRRVSRIWLDQDSCPTYLEKAEHAINNEKDRVGAYLNNASMEPLQRGVYIEVLKNHQAELLNKQTGVQHLLETNRTEDLGRMYRLFQKYPEDMEMIGKIVHEHIAREGVATVEKIKPAEGADDSLVKSMITLHDRYLTIVREQLGNNPIFQKALKNVNSLFCRVLA